MTEPARSFFVTGGTLSADARSYIRRQADTLLLAALQSGEFCYVLNTRQVGKSSLMVRTAHALRQQGRASVVLDITAGGFNLTPEAWYGGLLLQLGEQLARFLKRPELEEHLEEAFHEPPSLGPAHRFFSILEHYVLPSVGEQGLTVFVDEIDAVRLLPFSADEFFVGIRALYNRRAEAPPLALLTFCLIGVATPAQLIENPLVSPFNIGQKISLTDFSLAEAAPLAACLPRGHPDLERVLYWTGGHPYLTQRLCAALASTSGSVDQLVKQLFFSLTARESDDNLIFVAARLLRGTEETAAVLDLYGQIRRGKHLLDDPTSSVYDTLHLAGILQKQPNGTLRVRNRIYAHVFNESWVREHLPEQELHRQRAAFHRGALRIGAIACVLIAVLSSLTAWALLSAHRADQAAARADEAALAATRAQQLADQNRKLALASQARQARLAQERAEALRTREAALVQRERALADERKARAEADRANRSARTNLARVEIAFALRALTNAETETASDHLSAALRLGQLTPEQRRLAEFCQQALAQCAPRLRHRITCRGTISALTYSSDGKRLLVGTLEGWVQVFARETGRPLSPAYQHGAGITSIAFLPDGRLVSGGHDSRVRIWGGRQRLPEMVHTLERGAIFQLTPSQEGRRLISSGRGGCVVWNTQTGQEISRVWDDDLGGRWSAQKPSPIVTAYAARFTNATESQLAFAAYGYVCNLADVASGKMIHGFSAPLAAPHSAPDWIYQFVPSPDPKVFAVVGHYRSSSGNGAACLYNLETGRALSSLMVSASLPRSGSIDQSGTLLALGDEAGDISIWDLRSTTRQGNPYPLYGANRYVLGLQWLQGQDRLVAQTALGPVLFWSYQDKQVVTTRFRDSRLFALSPDTSELATTDTYGRLSLWRIPARQRRSILRITPSERGIMNEEAPLDSYTWATWLGETQESSVVVDLADGRLLRHTQLPDSPIRVSFSPDRRFLGVETLNSAELWELGKPRRLWYKLDSFNPTLALRWEKKKATLTRQDGSVEVVALP